MSIEYFVEGKVTTQTEGDQLNFSKGDIAINTTKNFNQQGLDTGISLNMPDEIHDNDTPINIIEVSLNLFFDGTQNNKTNTQSGASHESSNHTDDSYTNDYSNIAHGFDAIDPSAENQVRYYIEGIGTENGESETHLWGNVPNEEILFGTGPRGVKAKVTKGCVKGAEALKSYASRDIHLKVNVFGFSRGAAAARHFLHIASRPAEVLINSRDKGMALAPYDNITNRIEVKLDDDIVLKHGYFGACLSYWEIIPKKISYNFVGLYDTVASYGVNHRGGYGVQGDTEQLGLTAVSKANFILQIASSNEYRDNFDLTDINSASVQGLEITLPGVHSDIGGGYVEGQEENVDLYVEKGNAGKNCEKFKQILLEEGWFKNDVVEQLAIKYEKKYRRYKEVKGEGKFLLKGKRTLHNTYNKIPLNTMFYYSEEFKVIYLSKKVTSHKIYDTFLIGVHDQLLNYINACNNLRNTYIKNYNESNFAGNYLEKIKSLNYENYIDKEDLRSLRNGYLHWSASATKTGYKPIITTVERVDRRIRNTQQG